MGGGAPAACRVSCEQSLRRRLLTSHVGIVLRTPWLAMGLAPLWVEYVQKLQGGNTMHSIFYIIGVVVVVLIILGFLGLR